MKSYRLCYNTDHDIRVRHFVIFWLHLPIHVVDLLWASIHFDLPSMCEIASSFMLTCEFPLKEFRCTCQRHPLSFSRNDYYNQSHRCPKVTANPGCSSSIFYIKCLVLFFFMSRPVFFSHKASLVPSILGQSHPLKLHSAQSGSLVFYSF